MSVVAYQSIPVSLPLAAAPIQRGWVRGGQPDARNAVIARSTDRTAYTMVWDCSAGSFDWTYDCDETIYILEGSVLLTDAGNVRRRLGPGDAVFFPKGAQVHWEVETYVRKFAFMHDTLPMPVAVGMKAYRRLRSMVAGLLARRQAARPAARLQVEAGAA